MTTPFHKKSIPDKLKALACNLEDLFDDHNSSGRPVYWEDIQNAVNPDTLREIGQEVGWLEAEYESLRRIDE